MSPDLQIVAITTKKKSTRLITHVNRVMRMSLYVVIFDMVFIFIGLEQDPVYCIRSTTLKRWFLFFFLPV